MVNASAFGLLQHSGLGNIPPLAAEMTESVVSYSPIGKGCGIIVTDDSRRLHILERGRRNSVLFPRFRSKERDVRSDVERLTLVQNSIAKVISDVEQELLGLTARIEDARSRAAFLHGEMMEGESDDNARDAAILADAERVLLRGDRRIEEIHHNLAFLVDLRRRMTAETDRLRAYEAEGE